MLTIDPAKTAEQLVKFLQDSFQAAGFTRAVIATSGGVDSSTSLTLAVRALGKENVFPLLLPYGQLNPPGVTDARAVISWLQIPESNVTQIDIASLADPILALVKEMDQVRRGNIMARVRMIVLFDQAKKRQALVVGAENKSEYLLGYFTRFGDEASDIEPLRHFYKTQVYVLAKYLGVPEQILSKKPTAGLWEGQTDEGEFGFTYAEADQILHLLYDEKKSVEEVVAAGFSQATVAKVKAWVDKNSFKHHLPLTPEQNGINHIIADHPQ
ncbi:MAG: NAD+ synthase, partial [Patescibacteria group bacterium]